MDKDEAKELADKLKDKDGFLHEIAGLAAQANVMIRGLPKVVGAMDELIEKLRTPPRIKEMFQKEMMEDFKDAPWHEGDSWKGAEDLEMRVGSQVDMMQKWIDKHYKTKMTEVSSIRAMARTQIALAKGMQNLALLGLLVGFRVDAPLADCDAVLDLLTGASLDDGADP